MSELDWHALRRPLRGCAIAGLAIFGFLAFGGAPSVVIACWPLVLLASAGLSAYLIVSTRVPAAPATVPSLESGTESPDRDVNLDDPRGYARDISVKNDRH